MAPTVKYVTEEDAKNKLATHVCVGLHGIISIVQDYAKGGIQFDEAQIQRAIKRLDGVIQQQKDAETEVESAKQHQADMEQEWLNRDSSGRVQADDSGVA